jgi:hypothetical protein
VQHLAQDAAEVVELWEEVTWAQAGAIMAGAHANRAERIAQERAILLAFARREADKFVVACQSQDAIEEKLPSLVDKEAAIDWRPKVAEEQCESLVNKHTIL